MSSKPGKSSSYKFWSCPWFKLSNCWLYWFDISLCLIYPFSPGRAYLTTWFLWSRIIPPDLVCNRKKKQSWNNKHSSLHGLTVDHNTTVLLLVKYWDSKWTIGISLLNRQIVNKLNERWTIDTRTNLISKRFQQIGTIKSWDWDPIDLSFLVASFQQERHQTSSDGIPSLLLPVIGIIHLVNHYNQFLDSETLGKLHMFTSLAIFFKTSLILTFPWGNDKSSVICASCNPLSY